MYVRIYLPLHPQYLALHKDRFDHGCDHLLPSALPARSCPCTFSPSQRPRALPCALRASGPKFRAENGGMRVASVQLQLALACANIFHTDQGSLI